MVSKAGAVFVLGGIALAAVAASGGTAKAAEPAPPPKPSPDPSPSPAPAPPPDYLPGTTTLKSRVRTIDKSTPTPSQFALKYGGDGNRWKEIADANPTGTVYPGSPRIQVETWTQLDVDEDGNTLPTGTTVQGLSPWNLGQLVKLPDSWKG